MAGALLAAFGRSNVIVSDSSDDMLDLLAQGKAAMAYNVLDSYAQKRIDRGTPLRIVYPDDYTLVLSHAALIPRGPDGQTWPRASSTTCCQGKAGR